jgi:hypothetical protein
MKKIKILKEGTHVLPKGTVVEHFGKNQYSRVSLSEDTEISASPTNGGRIAVDFSQVEPLYPHKGMKVPKEGIPFADGSGELIDCGENGITYTYDDEIRFRTYDEVEPEKAWFILKRTLPETIEVCAECIKEVCECKKDYLRLTSYNNGILILAGKEQIGYITSNGKCKILNTESTIELYEKWRENSMLVDSTPVEWRGGKYIINESRRLERKDIPCGFIYDFGSCSYMPSCQDRNIMRFKHNNRPIGF